MNRAIINPQDYTQKYIEYLNKCFPNWGNEISYNWVFNRIVGKHIADTMILTDENHQVIAGSGVTFRNLKLQNSTIDIGIMTGSWTLAEARGKGCFTQIIEESLAICAQKNVPFLTAFVTESNASYRRLKEAGFYALEANNYFSTDKPFDIDESNFKIEFTTPNLDLLYSYYINNFKDIDAFLYSKDEFNYQYINRLATTYCIIINGFYFLFEENDTTVRLLYTSHFNIKAIEYFCNYIRHNKNKKVMFFTSDKEAINQCKEEQFNVIQSFLMIKSAFQKQDLSESDFTNLHINLADKM